MTLREALADDATGIRRRLDQVLDSEDAIVMLVDGRGATTYAHGFSASGCQLEMLGSAIELLLRQIVMGGFPVPGSDAVAAARRDAGATSCGCAPALPAGYPSLSAPGGETT